MRGLVFSIYCVPRNLRTASLPPASPLHPEPSRGAKGCGEVFIYYKSRWKLLDSEPRGCLDDGALKSLLVPWSL